MTARWLSSLEGGQTDPRMSSVLALAEALGCSLDEIVYGHQGRESTTTSTTRRLTPRQVREIKRFSTRWGTQVGDVWFPWVVAGFGPYSPQNIESFFDPHEFDYPAEILRIREELETDIRDRKTRGDETPYDSEAFKLVRFHVSDRVTPHEEPRLVLHFRPTTYFTMLATDQRLDVPFTAGGRTQTLRERYATDVDLRVAPVQELATHWGVGLAVVTRDGRLLVSERGNTAVDPNICFPAVAESASRAMDSGPAGAPDQWSIAQRGVREELGIQISPDELAWLSFGANSYLCEYGLIGLVRSSESLDQIERLRSMGAAQDSWETRRLHRVDFNPKAVARFCGDFGRRWSAFGLIAVVHALMAEFGPQQTQAAFEGISVHVVQHLPADLPEL